MHLDDVLVNMPTIPALGEGSSNFGLDLNIKLGPKIHFYNKYLYDLWLKGDMKVSGSTLYTVIGGTLSTSKGTINYLMTHFKINSEIGRAHV